MQALAPFVPTMLGGSADLASSVGTRFDGESAFTREHAGRNVHWGVREHAMAAAVNGLALHGGIVRPYGSTFLQFADYMRPAIRLSALMGLRVAWVFSHDSVALGEDGPTHQPIEQLAALRAIPGLTVIRPCDAAEAAVAWQATLELVEGPACLVLSRQALPILDRPEFAAADGLLRGAYVLADGAQPEAVMVGTARRCTWRSPRAVCSRAGDRARGRVDAQHRAVRRPGRGYRGSCCRPGRRRCRSRRASRRGGSGGSTRASRSSGSAPRRPGRRSCSSASGSRRRPWRARRSEASRR